MGYYARVVFPRLCDFFLDQPFVTEQRRLLLSAAAGEVLEIGFGTGLNLPNYPAAVHKLTAVDPNAGMHQRARQRIDETKIEVKLQKQRGEQLPFHENAFDCVVCTFTLCSVHDAQQTLREVFRVLKPAGKFLFLEHGLSPDKGVQCWQRRLNWLQGQLGDGCRLDRNVLELVAALPFAGIDCREFYLERSPKTHGYIYRGSATK